MIKTIAAPFRLKTTADRPHYDVSRTQFFLEDIENKLKLKSSVSLQTWSPSEESLAYIADMTAKFKERKRPHPIDPLAELEGGIGGDEPAEKRFSPASFQPMAGSSSAAMQSSSSRSEKGPGEVFINEEDERRHYLYQYAYLERLYPNEHIGNARLREALPLDQLKNDYIMLSKRFDMDARIEMFITCFIFAFMMLEKFTGLEGLLKHHVEHMSTYQRLLLKMNDKPLFKMLDNMAPEVVLVGMIFLQTGIFYCTTRWFPGNQDLIKKMGAAMESAVLKNVK